MELNGLLLSDIHSGSWYAPVLPKARVDYDGGTIGLNPLQEKILLPHWKKMCDGGPYDFVVVNGDLVDGLNRKEKGLGLWTCVLDLQADACASLLNAIKVKKDAPFIIIGGTGYHVGDNPGIDQLTAEKLAKLGKNAKYKGLEHILQFGKQKIHFSHWVSDAMYDGTTLSKEILFSKKHDIDATGFIRGHRHHYGCFTDGERFSAILPGWKCRDAYVQGRGMRYATTQIGWVELFLTEDTWELKPHLKKLNNTMSVTRLGKVADRRKVA